MIIVTPDIVMAGLDPFIHVLTVTAVTAKTWMAASSGAMTMRAVSRLSYGR
jgi:hypothetical protein